MRNKNTAPIADKGQARSEGAISIRRGRWGTILRLYGHKHQASFALIRTRGKSRREPWPLIKHADGYTQSGYDATVYDFSAASGRSLAEIAAEPDPHP